MCVCVCVCVHFFINTNFVDIIDISCLHIFLLILLYCRIDFIVFGGILIYIFSIIVYFPSTFCSALGHHQRGCITKVM